jgi:hypothetical protein
MSDPKHKPFNEDSGRFPIIIEMERPEESPTFFDDIAKVGAQIDEQLTGQGDAQA